MELNLKKNIPIIVIFFAICLIFNLFLLIAFRPKAPTPEQAIGFHKVSLTDTVASGIITIFYVGIAYICYKKTSNSLFYWDLLKFLLFFPTMIFRAIQSDLFLGGIFHAINYNFIEAPWLGAYFFVGLTSAHSHPILIHFHDFIYIPITIAVLLAIDYKKKWKLRIIPFFVITLTGIYSIIIGTEAGSKAANPATPGQLASFFVIIGITIYFLYYEWKVRKKQE